MMAINRNNNKTKQNQMMPNSGEGVGKEDRGKCVHC